MDKQIYKEIAAICDELGSIRFRIGSLASSLSSQIQELRPIYQHGELGDRYRDTILQLTYATESIDECHNFLSDIKP